MPVRVRADLAAMPDYVPGRKIAGAINLSSNEVSYPPPAAIVAAVSEAAATVHRYPAMGSDDDARVGVHASAPRAGGGLLRALRTSARSCAMVNCRCSNSASLRARKLRVSRSFSLTPLGVSR